MFDSVVAGAFQITFRAKIYANDVFSFFKNHFWHQHIKTIQNVQTILNFSKKKLKFFGNAAAAAFPNVPKFIFSVFKRMLTRLKMHMWLAGCFRSLLVVLDLCHFVFLSLGRGREKGRGRGREARGGCW